MRATPAGSLHRLRASVQPPTAPAALSLLFCQGKPGFLPCRPPVPSVLGTLPGHATTSTPGTCVQNASCLGRVPFLLLAAPREQSVLAGCRQRGGAGKVCPSHLAALAHHHHGAVPLPGLAPLVSSLFQTGLVALRRRKAPSPPRPFGGLNRQQLPWTECVGSRFTETFLLGDFRSALPPELQSCRVQLLC